MMSIIKDRFTEFWDKKYYLWPSGNNVKLEFSISEFKDIVWEGNLFFPQLTCLDKEGHINPLRYINSDKNFNNCSIHQIRVLELFSKGITVRIRNLDLCNKFIKNLKFNLIDIFGCNITINGYLSNSLSEGINPHYDVYHIFVIQVSGKKNWVFGQRSHIVPRFDHRPDCDPKNFSAVETVTLQSGGMLYIPPGLWHKTDTPDESLHLAIEIQLPDWTEYLNKLTNHAMHKHDCMRSSLPFELENNKFIYKQNLKDELRNILSLLERESEDFEYVNNYYDTSI